VTCTEVNYFMQYCLLVKCCVCERL